MRNPPSRRGEGSFLNGPSRPLFSRHVSREPIPPQLRSLHARPRIHKANRLKDEPQNSDDLSGRHSLSWSSPIYPAGTRRSCRRSAAESTGSEGINISSRCLSQLLLWCTSEPWSQLFAVYMASSLVEAAKSAALEDATPPAEVRDRWFCNQRES